MQGWQHGRGLFKAKISAKISSLSRGVTPPPPGAFEATLVQTQTICEKIGTRLIQVSFHAVLGSLFLVWGAWQYARKTLKTLAYVFCKRLLQVREYLTPNK